MSERHVARAIKKLLVVAQKNKTAIAIAAHNGETLRMTLHGNVSEPGMVKQLFEDAISLFDKKKPS